jgi:hypothetical protein
MELSVKDSSSIPRWALLLPALLASLLQAMLIRPLVVGTRAWVGRLVSKLHDACPYFPLAPRNPRWLQVLTSDVIRILLSEQEQTSLLLLYVLAPRLFDVRFKLKVQVGMLRVTLLLLLKSMARLLLRLAAVTSEFMENVGRVHKPKPPNRVHSQLPSKRD